MPRTSESLRIEANSTDNYSVPLILEADGADAPIGFTLG